MHWMALGQITWDFLNRYFVSAHYKISKLERTYEFPVVKKQNRNNSKGSEYSCEAQYYHAGTQTWKQIWKHRLCMKIFISFHVFVSNTNWTIRTVNRQQCVSSSVVPSMGPMCEWYLVPQQSSESESNTIIYYFTFWWRVRTQSIEMRICLPIALISCFLKLLERIG